jgi:hypothetical protein
MIGRIFRDMLFIFMMAFMMMVFWMLPFLNDPPEKDDSTPPGNIMVYITWPEGDIDVDLWVTGPGQPRAVGYSNLSSVLWDLLRDDLGNSGDTLPLNFENAYSRGAPPGSYWVNLHCYNCSVYSVTEVNVEISIRRIEGDTIYPTEVLHSGVYRLRQKQEITVLNFQLDDDAKVIPGSENNVFKPLKITGPQVDH